MSLLSILAIIIQVQSMFKFHNSKVKAQTDDRILLGASDQKTVHYVAQKGMD